MKIWPHIWSLEALEKLPFLISKKKSRWRWPHYLTLGRELKVNDKHVVVWAYLPRLRERDGLPNDAPDAEQLAAAGTPQQQVAAAQQLQQPPTQQINQIQFQGHQHHGHHLQQLWISGGCSLFPLFLITFWGLWNTFEYFDITFEFGIQ